MTTDNNSLENHIALVNEAVKALEADMRTVLRRDGLGYVVSLAAGQMIVRVGGMVEVSPYCAVVTQENAYIFSRSLHDKLLARLYKQLGELDAHLDKLKSKIKRGDSK